MMRELLNKLKNYAVQPLLMRFAITDEWWKEFCCVAVRSLCLASVAVGIGRPFRRVFGQTVFGWALDCAAIWLLAFMVQVRGLGIQERR